MTTKPARLLQLVVRNSKKTVICLFVLTMACRIGLCDQNVALKTKQPPGKTNAAETDASNKILEGPELPDNATWPEALRSVVLTAIPDQYEDRSHWGETIEIFDGLKVKQRGFDIRVSQRKKSVNHGAWHRYRVEFVDPKTTLNLKVENLRSSGPSQFQFDINLTSKLRCRGDFEHWVLGVKGFNVTVVSLADVQISANCGFGQFPIEKAYFLT